MQSKDKVIQLKVTPQKPVYEELDMGGWFLIKIETPSYMYE